MAVKKRETREQEAPTETSTPNLSEVYVADQNAKEQEEASRGDVTNVSEDPGKPANLMTPKEYANRFKTVQKYLRENAPETAPASSTKTEGDGDDSSE